MTKGKRTKEQIMTCKKLHRKLKMKQNAPNWKSRVNSGVPEDKAGKIRSNYRAITNPLYVLTVYISFSSVVYGDNRTILAFNDTAS